MNEGILKASIQMVLDQKKSKKTNLKNILL